MKTGGTCSTGRLAAAGRRALLLLPVLFAPCALRAGEGPFSVVFKGNLTTSSLIYVTPDAPDPVEQGNTFSLSGAFGYGAEVRYRLPESNIAFGLGADYLSSSGTSTLNGTLIPTKDGYTAFTVELTGYFILPLSGQRFGVYMGGGGGMYFGRREYSLAGVEAASIDNTPGFAIHVVGGISYMFLDGLQGSFEMKFRDLQFTSVNAFRSPAIRFEDTIINVGTTPFRSRVETDGIVFNLGLSYSF